MTWTLFFTSAFSTSGPLPLAGQRHDTSSSSKYNDCCLPLPWASGRGAWLSCPWCRPEGSTRHEDAAKMSAGSGNRGSGLGWASREDVSSGSFCSTSSTCRPPGGARSQTSSEGEKSGVISVWSEGDSWRNFAEEMSYNLSGVKRVFWCMKSYAYASEVPRTHNLVILPALITPPDLLDKSHSTLQSEKVCPTKKQEVEHGGSLIKNIDLNSQNTNSKETCRAPEVLKDTYFFIFHTQAIRKTNMTWLWGLCWYKQNVLFLPLFEATHGLLDEDDLVGDRLVPLDLQLHVMVVLTTETKQQINRRNMFIKTGLPQWIMAQEPNLIPYNLSWSSARMYVTACNDNPTVQICTALTSADNLVRPLVPTKLSTQIFLRLPGGANLS